MERISECPECGKASIWPVGTEIACTGCGEMIKTVEGDTDE